MLSKKKKFTDMIAPIVVSVLATTLIIVAAEYFFHIPSAFFPSQTPTTTTQVAPTTETPIEDMGACTREYAPVCARLIAECTTLPCTPLEKTYPNACEAKRDHARVISVGECPLPVSSIDTSTQTGTVVPPVMTGAITASGSISTGNTLPKTNTGTMPPAREPQTPPIMSGVSTGSGVDFGNTGAYIQYQNTNFKYALALPKYVYYKGFSGVNGANHSLEIALTATGTETSGGGDVSVYFYKNGIPESFPGDHDTVTLTIPSGYLVVTGNSSNPKVAKIIDTIRQSAR